VCIKKGKFFSVRGTKGFCDTCYGTILLIESKDESATKVNLINMFQFNLVLCYLPTSLQGVPPRVPVQKDPWAPEQRAPWAPTKWAPVPRAPWASAKWAPVQVELERSPAAGARSPAEAAGGPVRPRWAPARRAHGLAEGQQPTVYL